MFLYKIVNYLYVVAKIVGIFTVVIIAFYLSGNPIGNYTSEKGMTTIILAIGLVAIVRYIFRKTLSSKNLI